VSYRRDQGRTARNAIPADVQFAGRADGNRLPLLVQDIELRIVDGPSNGDRAHNAFVSRNFIDAAAHDRLGRAVLVDQASIRRMCLPEGDVFTPQCFSADDERPRPAGDFIRRHEMAEDVEMRRSQFDQAEVALAPHRVAECLAAWRFGQQYDAAAC
jgi:hypothetical protein